LLRRKGQGFVPVAVALVFGPEVEGANLMKAHYLNAYKLAGIEGHIFDNEEIAKEWVASVIAEP